MGRSTQAKESCRSYKKTERIRRETCGGTPIITIKIDPNDLRELHKDLKALRPKKLIGRDLDPLGKSIIKMAGKYPPPVSTSRRTGKLGRSWYHTVFGLDLKIGNLATFAGYVHGEAQTQVHARHGWKRVFDVTVDEVDKLIKKLGKRIDKLWK